MNYCTLYKTSLVLRSVISLPYLIMNLSTRIISSLSIASLAIGTTAPALAYVVDDALAPTSEGTVSVPRSISTLISFGQNLILGPRTPRQITSRTIRSDRNQNGILNAGLIRVNGGERGEAEEMESGRILLPVRGELRQPRLRNVNRHLLGRERPQGAYKNVTTYEQGDIRRRPLGVTNANVTLPPVLVQTGSNENHPNWRRWARGRTDASNMRNINSYNRPDYE